MMPFDKSFDDIYQLGIKTACDEAGAYCERIDEQIFDENIMERIYNQIAKADLIVADMSGRNPNVFYEVGYAHAIGKKVVLITNNGNDIPFDLKQYHHVIYNSIVYIKDKLTERIRWYVANPSENKEETKNPFKVIIRGVEIPSDDFIEEFPYHNGGCSLYFSVCNCSDMIIDGKDIAVGVISDRIISRVDNILDSKGVDKSSFLADGKNLHIITNVNKFFCHQSQQFYMLLCPDDRCDSSLPKDYNIIIRIFTKHGNYDFPVVLRRMPEKTPETF